MAEYILPETDTPGARAAHVDRFIDTMLTDYSAEADRQRFVAGLGRADVRVRQVFGQSFLDLAAEEQLELVLALNREAFRSRGTGRPGSPEPVAEPEDPVLQENDVHTGNERVLPTLDRDWDPDDSGPGAFFRTLKELVVVGYYTSEIGATLELHVNPIGSWRADIPYADIGRSWA